MLSTVVGEEGDGPQDNSVGPAVVLMPGLYSNYNIYYSLVLDRSQCHKPLQQYNGQITGATGDQSCPVKICDSQN